jgi:hypothetical protein
MKPLLISFCVAVSTVGMPSQLASQYLPREQELVWAFETRGDTLYYARYRLSGTGVVTLNDLVLQDSIRNAPDPLDIIYFRFPDFKEELLRKGLATLRQPETAPAVYRTAQQSAQRQVDIRRTDSTAKNSGATAPDTSATRRPVSSNRWSWLTKGIGWLASIGVLAFFGQTIWHWVYGRKRIRLILIGEPSAGKTAVLHRLLDPNVDRHTIETLAPSKAVEILRKKGPIDMGKYEIHPVFADIPGAKYGSVLDELIPTFPTLERLAPNSTFWDVLLLRRLRIFVAVVAPSRAAPKHRVLEPDTDYITQQLTTINGFINGSLSSTKARRPRLVILFINKFDQLSPVPPDDSTAQSAREHAYNLFDKHITSVRDAAKRASVPQAIILGSALQNWNCDRIIASIRRELYGHY